MSRCQHDDCDREGIAAWNGCVFCDEHVRERLRTAADSKLVARVAELETALHEIADFSEQFIGDDEDGDERMYKVHQIADNAIPYTAETKAQLGCVGCVNALNRIAELEAAIEQVVKRTPFVASATGITLEMPFETIRLLQAAMKGREKPP
jgi:hypothetical protein